MTLEKLEINKARVVAVSLSERKGTKKYNVGEAVLREDFGMLGDSHSGTENRQISLLAEESIQKMREKGLKCNPGDFAENITTSGLDLMRLKLGERLMVGKEAILEISQIGKVCHTRCEIFYQAGDCVMPREGVFAKVVMGGAIKGGDEIKVI